MKIILIAVIRYFWIVFIIAAIINTFIVRRRSKKHIAKSPELAVGYEKLFRGMIIFGNLPSIIMGIGILTGLACSMFDYFQPNSLNPIVLIFHFSIIALWILSIWWIYFNRGAEFIEKHPGLLYVQGFGDRKKITAKQLKLF